MRERCSALRAWLGAALREAMCRLAVRFRRARAAEPPRPRGLAAAAGPAGARAVIVHCSLRVEVRMSEARVPLGLAIALRLLERGSRSRALP